MAEPLTYPPEILIESTVELPPEFGDDGINEVTGELVRKEWSREALHRKDQEIAAAEQLYRDCAVNAATELIQLLERPS